MNNITRRQFTSICAASLAVPGMLPLQKQEESFLYDPFADSQNYAGYKPYEEICREDWCRLKFRNDNWRHTDGAGCFQTLRYVSPIYKTHVPYEHGFCIDQNKWDKKFSEERKNSKWVWGLSKVIRIVRTKYKVVVKRGREHLLIHSEEDALCLVAITKLEPMSLSNLCEANDIDTSNSYGRNILNYVDWSPSLEERESRLDKGSANV